MMMMMMIMMMVVAMMMFCEFNVRTKLSGILMCVAIGTADNLPLP
jgi:hypothetical protein